MATASDETTGCGRRDWKKPSKYSVCCSVERYGSPVFAFNVKPSGSFTPSSMYQFSTMLFTVGTPDDTAVPMTNTIRKEWYRGLAGTFNMQWSIFTSPRLPFAHSRYE